MPDTEPSLILCGLCDEALAVPPLNPGESAECPSCMGEVSYRAHVPYVNSVAFALTALIFLAIVARYPFLKLSIGSISSKSSVPDAALALWSAGYPILCVLVMMLTMVIPATRLLALLYVAMPLAFGRKPSAYSWLVFRLAKALSAWSMLDVFFVGVLVAVVKLADLASVSPQIGLIAFMSLMALSFLAFSTLDEEALWEAIRLHREELSR